TFVPASNEWSLEKPPCRLSYSASKVSFGSDSMRPSFHAPFTETVAFAPIFTVQSSVIGPMCTSLPTRSWQIGLRSTSFLIDHEIAPDPSAWIDWAPWMPVWTAMSTLGGNAPQLSSPVNGRWTWSSSYVREPADFPSPFWPSPRRQKPFFR